MRQPAGVGDQIVNSALADVIATANNSTMVRLVISGLVRAARAFCKNKLEIHRSAGQPEGHQDTGRSRHARGLRWCLPRRASRLATTYAAQGPKAAR